MSSAMAAKNIDRGLLAIKEAVKADTDRKYTEAYDKYRQGTLLLACALQKETQSERRKNLEGYLERAVDRMEQIKKALGVTPQKKENPSRSQQQNELQPSNSSAAQPNKAEYKPTKDSSNKVNNAKKKAEKQTNHDGDALKNAIFEAIVRMKPDVKWDDVVGLQSAKEALKEAVILPFRFPQLFQGKREPWRGILLYGCPGTGKSFLAKAVATECDATFFSVSSSDLVSKYVGESARLIRALFEMARAEKQAVIFIDEVDSLVSSRNGEESDASRQIKTEFLVQMQGVGNAGGNILVLGATNYPEALDSAIRRRFEKRIEIVLPDAFARASIMRNEIGSTPNALVDEDYIELGKQTENYSGSDLSILCKDALMDPVRILQRAIYFRLNQLTGLYEVSCSDIPGAEQKNFMEIPSEKLTVPYVTINSMMKAKSCVKPSVSSKDKERIAKFTAEFGSL